MSGLLQAAPFVDLTHFVDPDALEDLDAYLLACGIHDVPMVGSGGSSVEVGTFSAGGRRYSDAIELCDRDTSTWAATLPESVGADDFRACRAHRGDPLTWRPNANAAALPGVATFVRALPFFEHTGKVP